MNCILFTFNISVFSAPSSIYFCDLPPFVEIHVLGGNREGNCSSSPVLLYFAVDFKIIFNAGIICKRGFKREWQSSSRKGFVACWNSRRWFKKGKKWRHSSWRHKFFTFDMFPPTNISMNVKGVKRQTWKMSYQFVLYTQFLDGGRSRSKVAERCCRPELRLYVQIADHR